MKAIDLHTHSNASDGTDTPAEIVNRAIQKGLAAVALTDHDTVAGMEEALNAAEKSGGNIQVIPGTELSVAYKNKDIHIIGLFMNHKDAYFQKITEEIIERRQERNRKMVDNLQRAGIPITLDALTCGNPDTVITRAHFARYLVEQHITASPNEAFRKYLDTTTPYYVPRIYIEPEEGIALIRHAGGIPILAHPLQYNLSENELNTLLRRLTDSGLAGLEVIYSSHSRQDEMYARSLARKYHLLYSGGSDYHGSNKPAIDIGIGRGNLKIPYSFLDKLAASCNFKLQ